MMVPLPKKPLPRVTPNMKLALTKAGIVMGPTYLVAWMSDKMVYVVPTLAAVSFLAAAIGSEDINRLIDDGDAEDGDADGAGGSNLEAIDAVHSEAVGVDLE